MRIEACCKINIGLNVLSRREDGYHDINTLMYPVKDLYDTIDITAAKETEFSCDGIAIDCPEQDNLCIKAYGLLKKRFGIGGAKIKLRKRIPFGAGLGGGSSDAAAVLKALDRIYDLQLSESQLEELAAETGCDAPFFIRSMPRMCSGRGEIMTDYSLNLSGMYLLLAKPPQGVSTKEAYAGIVPAVPDKRLEELLAGEIRSWRENVANDFEKTVFAIHPEIAQLKHRLYDTGAVYASMSGSGSAVFGLFDKIPDSSFPAGYFSITVRL